MGVLWVCIGGAVGSGARYLVSLWASERWGPGFPWGTLGVNVVGSLLLAVLLGRGIALQGDPSRALNPSMQLALTTGAMGGFTTFSTFSYEAMRLFERGESKLSLLYVGATMGLGLAASVAGFAMGRWSA